MESAVRSKPRRRMRVALFLVALTLLTYVGSSAVLSRRGMALSHAAGFDGFYFFPPEDTDVWRKWNFGLVRLYYPLIVIEMWLGTIDGIGCEPTWRLSDRPSRRNDVCVALDFQAVV